MMFNGGVITQEEFDATVAKYNRVAVPVTIDNGTPSAVYVDSPSYAATPNAPLSTWEWTIIESGAGNAIVPDALGLSPEEFYYRCIIDVIEGTGENLGGYGVAIPE